MVRDRGDMTRLATGDGLTLEGTWTEASGEALGVVVFCHPDPRARGTMRAPLMRAVARHLGAAGLHVLRFNFRGVGESTGSWGGGKAEIEDVAAAVAAAHAAHPHLDVSVAGWSFGAVVALLWQARDHSSLTYAGIAPAIGLPGELMVPPAEELAAARRFFVIGDRDQYTPVNALDRYAVTIDAEVRVMEGSDHFFYFRHDRLAEVVAAHLGGRTLP